jgi:hypothetical protein
MLRAIELVSPLIKIWEKKQYKKNSVLSLKHQPIFIIGAPRTGSTILYQALTNQLDVLYIDNLACKFHKNLLFGFKVSNFLFKQRAHNSFKSNHGVTKGLHSPSECGNFWYKWLPKNRHFIDYEDLTDEMIKEIRDELSSIINTFDKPLLFKNLNAGQRLRLLVKVFPEARFIFSRRNPLYTSQSILQAKRKLGISDNSFWSVMPKNHETLKKLDWPEQITGQVYFLEKQIENDLQLFEKKQIQTIYYENIGDDSISEIAKNWGIKKRKSYEPTSINCTEIITLNKNDEKLLVQQINKIDW